MAGAGYKLFVNGNTLSASDLNTYVQQQTVMVFASASARTTALSGVLAEGMVSYRTDSHVFEIYNGSAWVSAGISSPLTTKGDLWGYDTAGNRIPVGSNNQVLTADSTQALGVKWATPSSGSMTLISRQTLSASTAYSFSSIPGTYTDLMLRWVGVYQSDNASVFSVRFNSSTSLYGYYLTQGTSASTAGVDVNETASNAGYFSTGATRSDTSTQLGSLSKGNYRIANYANTSYAKYYDINVGYYNNSAGNVRTYVGTGIFYTTAAVTSVDIVRLSGTGTMTTVPNGFVELWGIN